MNSGQGGAGQRGSRQDDSPVISAAASTTADWLVSLNTHPDPDLRLFCFPHNSGSIASFYTWPEQLPPQVEVWGIQLPGSSDRRQDVPLPDIPTVVQTLTPLLKPYLDRPFAFYGYSLGALISFEVAHALWQQAQPLPKMLWVGSWSAPHLLNPYPALAGKTDAEVIRDILPLLDVPEAVRQDNKVMRSLLPLLRNGAQLLERYQYIHTQPLPCPITVYSGDSDQVIRGHYINQWQQHTTHPLITQQFAGGHLFLQQAQDPLLTALSTAITSLLA